MKPLIISIEKSDKNEVKFKKDEFEKIIEQVYLSGVYDGKQSAQQDLPKKPIRNFEADYGRIAPSNLPLTCNCSDTRVD